VVISGDRDPAGFQKTIEGAPWVAMRTSVVGGNDTAKDATGKKIPCTGYPTPGIISAMDGRVILADAYDTWTNQASMLQTWLSA
jgi:hypothetical protein